MDPNANLKEQAECLADLAGRYASLTAFCQDLGLNPDKVGATGPLAADWRGARTYTRTRLADLRSALTEWLHKGGCAPDWTRYPTAARYYPQARTVRPDACACGQLQTGAAAAWDDGSHRCYADPLAPLNAAVRHTLSTGRVENEPMPGDN